VKAIVAAAVLACVVGACSSTSRSGSDVPPDVDAGNDTVAPDVDAGVTAAPVEASVPSGKCADTFGSALTEGFGRIDGIVYAVQKPSDTMCTLPNGDHVILQVLMNGAVYRLVVNVQSDRGGADPKIRVATLAHALPAPAFAEGWHLPAPLDYVTSLGAHADATTKIAAELKIGDPVSVYATSGAGRPESAHLIHRNDTNEDGAIVVTPTTSPRFLLFHFDGQTF
jgi:hypothetical protein